MDYHFRPINDESLENVMILNKSEYLGITSESDKFHTLIFT